MGSTKPTIDIGKYVNETQAVRRRRARFFLVLGICSALVVIFIFISWIVIQSSLFRVKSLRIEGNKNISSPAILSLLEGSVFGGSWGNYLLGFMHMLTWPKEIPENALAYLPSLKKIEIQKDYIARDIKVVVQERIPYGIWCSHGEEKTECVWFDEEGIVIQRTLSSEGGLLKKGDDYFGDIPVLGKPILPERFIPALMSVFRVISASRLSVQEVRLEDIKLEEVKVVPYEGPLLYFSLRFPADRTLPIIQSFLAGTESVHFNALQYLDFRVENRVYYK